MSNNNIDPPIDASHDNDSIASGLSEERERNRVSLGGDGVQDEDNTNANDDATNTSVAEEPQDPVAALTAALQAVLNISGGSPSSRGNSNTNTSSRGGSSTNANTARLQSTRSGLDLRRRSRTTKEQRQARVHSKYTRGSTPTERLKTEKIATATLPIKLTTSIIMSLSNTTEIDEHKIAADCKNWQDALRGLTDRLTKFDMTSIFAVPARFDEVAGTIEPGTKFINILEKWDGVDLKECARWTLFMNGMASDEDIESDTWAQVIMSKSMDDDLLSSVMDEFDRLEEEEQSAVTMFKIMIDIMVIRNQEALDALQTFIKDFDIRAYDGQNVSKAASHLKAVLRALGKDIPANAARSIVNGMAYADNKEFKDLCTASGAYFSSSFITSTLPAHLRDPKECCLTLLRDFETRYQQLMTAKKWNSVTHKASTFTAQLADMSDDDYEAYAARALLPFEEWVKAIRCNFCGELGHIKADCPKNPHRRTEQERAAAIAGRARGFGGGRVSGRGLAGRGRSFGRGPFSRGVGRGYGHSGGIQRGQRDRMQRAYAASKQVFNAIMDEGEDEEVDDAEAGDDQDIQDVENESEVQDEEEHDVLAAMWQSIGSTSASSLKE